MILQTLQLLVFTYLIFILLGKTIGHWVSKPQFNDLAPAIAFMVLHVTSIIATIEGFPRLPLAVSLIFTLAYCGYATYRWHRIVKDEITPSSIRKAMDNLPIGLSYVAENGTPLLTNRKMYQLAETITGSIYLNGEEFWNHISRGGVIEEPLIDLADQTDKSDQIIWKFTKEEFNYDGNSYYQITATDVTRLSRLADELVENNMALDKQITRLKILANEVEAIKREEEILASKIRLHDELGRNILAGNLLLSKSPAPESTSSPASAREELNSVFEMWESLLLQLSRGIFSQGDYPINSKGTQMRQLLDASAALGCEVYFIGKLPRSEQASHLILTAVKEAVSNAVRHGKADRLNVDLKEMGDCAVVEIWDNGDALNAPVPVNEGGGLGNLRKQIESAGGHMEAKREKDFRDNAVFKLYITLPLNNTDENTGGPDSTNREMEADLW